MKWRRKKMNFGKQIKQIRTKEGLTQEQMAQKLNVTRQAISNWENDKNLPDLELLIQIAQVFSLSLDQLILGGNDMNNMTEKLIKDGSETRRAKFNMVSIAIGAVLLLIGVGCIILKGMTVEYIDAEGVLHENFFLIPIGFLFMFSGFITFVVTGIRGFINRFKAKNNEPLTAIM
jgi:transcriptional regulator with XRE-family HTH domain